MNAVDILKQAQERASEWTEMSDDPAALVAGILATKIVRLNDYIEYLEQRLKNDSSSTARVN